MMMIMLAALFALASSHAQPLETVQVVDTVDTGVLRFLIKGPCSPQILEEFNDLTMICNRYSRHPAQYMRWSTNKWDVMPGVHAIANTMPTTGGDKDASPTAITGDADYYKKALLKKIRLNHVTVAIECCDAVLEDVSQNSAEAESGSATGSNNFYSTLSAPVVETTVAGYGWYPCHDLMRSLYEKNMLPNSVELYSGGFLAGADTDTVDPTTSNPNINDATHGGP